MPNYSTRPVRGSLTIREAIVAGERSIARPGWMILVFALAAGILASLAGASLWYLPGAIAAGVVLSIVYARWMTARWRLWAYAGVSDIHQLQRAAELATLLPPNVYQEPYGIMSFNEAMQLHELQQRFEDEQVFVDDTSIAPSTSICESDFFVAKKEWVLELSEKGIRTDDFGFFKWEDIRDEHVGFASYRPPESGGSGFGRQSSGKGPAFFRFYTGDDCINYPLDNLDVKPWMLDLLLYLYRGR